MHKSLLLAVIASSVLTIGVASAQAPSPSPAPTATATPPAGPIYKGRPCGVGTLIHDFLIIQEPPPGPQATCLQPVTSTAPERLYRLRTVPDGMRFEGVMRDDSRGQGLVYVLYKSLADPEGGPPVQIQLSRVYNDPDPVLLRDASVATAADFLPAPGIALRDDPVLRVAAWHEAAGSYHVIIDPGKTTLTLEQVAALLEPFTPPGPPDTGNAVNAVGSDGMAWGAVSLAGAALAATAGALSFLVARRRLRTAP